MFQDKIEYYNRQQHSHTSLQKVEHKHLKEHIFLSPTRWRAIHLCYISIKQYVMVMIA